MNSTLFEWRLIMRNKRLRMQFLFAFLYFPVLFFIKITTIDSRVSFWHIEFCFLTTFTLSATLATYTFGIHSAFIEKQLTTPLTVFEILRAKYLFFVSMSLVLFVVFLPTVFFGINVFEIIAALFYDIGLVFFCLFCTALFAYKPFDIKASTFTNYQGIDAGSFFLPGLAVAVTFALVAILFWLFGENIALIIMFVIGLIFIATHKIWLKMIANKFYETKYKRLERFREK